MKAQHDEVNSRKSNHQLSDPDQLNEAVHSLNTKRMSSSRQESSVMQGIYEIKRIEMMKIHHDEVISRELNRQLADLDQFNEAVHSLNTKRLSSNRRQSSVMQGIYEIKRIDKQNEENPLGFTKAHLLNIHLNGNNKSNERKPSLINAFNEAKRLRLIQKLNPMTIKSFNQIDLMINLDKPKTKIDIKSNIIIDAKIRVDKSKLYLQSKFRQSK